MIKYLYTFPFDSTDLVLLLSAFLWSSILAELIPVLREVKHLVLSMGCAILSSGYVCLKSLFKVVTETFT